MLVGLALDTLVLIDDVQLADGTFDGIDRAVAAALGTTDTVTGDGQAEQLGAGSGRAFLVADMGNIFIAEVTQRGEDRVGSRLTKAAESGIGDGLRQIFQFVEHLFGAFAVTDFFEHFQHTAGTDTAGSAFPAGFVFGEFQIELRHGGHAVLVGQHDHTAGTHHGTDLAEVGVVDGGIEVFFGDTAAGGTAGLHSFDFITAGDTAADFVDDFTEGCAHGDFNQTDS